jgi:hypothetical protein
MARHVVLLAVALSLVQGARAEDPPATPLDMAKVTYQTTIDEAKKEVLDLYDLDIQKVAKEGNLDAVRAIRAEKSEFETSGRIAPGSRLRNTMANYQQATKQARADLSKAYEEAIREATKALEIERAEMLDAEFKDFKKATAAIEPAKPAPAAKPAAGGPAFQYTFYEWKKGEPPLKMIHSGEGFCYLAGIQGALHGGGEAVQVTIGKDGFWYVHGESATDQPLNVRAVAVKVGRKGM